MKRDQIDFPSRHEALREDVSLLGGMVGELLREQCGETLFQRVESARAAAIDRRTGDAGGESLQALCGFEEPLQASNFVRAFATWFRMVNLAEQIHRIRRRREYRAEGERVQPESLADVFRQLAEAGTGWEEMLSVLNGLLIEPVFTAHPTEATRRSILEKEQRMAGYLVQRMNPGLPTREADRLVDRVRMEATIAWQTAEQSHVRPTVADEAEHAHYYLADVLYRIAPVFHENLAEAVSIAWGEEVWPGDLPTVLRFGSWVGGDMDGNPNVGPDTVLDTLTEQRRQVVGNYIGEVRRLNRLLSQSAGRVSVAPALTDRIRHYRNIVPEVDERVPDRHADMPYRVFLYQVEARLQATLKETPSGYGRPEEFLADLDLVGDSLRSHRGIRAGLFPVERLRRRAEIFGFHLAALDLRIDSGDLHQAVGELIGDADWPERAPEDRTRYLAEATAGGDVPDGHEAGVSHPVFKLLAAAATVHQRFGERAITTVIISMSRNADDILAAWFMAQAAGLGRDKVDVVPLFETVGDLEAAEGVMEGLLKLEVWCGLLERRGNRQMIMLGYSDSNKDGGLVASRWSLQDAQRRLVELFAGHGIKVVFFHGRGGTVGRGGGKTHRAVLASPAGSVAGHLRMTEQGEVIHRKYALRPIALRNLEQTAGAVIKASMKSRVEAPDRPHWHQWMRQLAGHARHAYRDLVYGSEDFTRYFRQATPIDVIERMRMGSRPASRAQKTGIEGLRAIPWVFAWGQSRHGLPGWYGLGSGLQAMEAEIGAAALADMAENWMFVANLLSDAEMAMAKADMDIASRYAGLSGDLSETFFARINREFGKTREMICKLKDQQELLDRDPTLKRSILLRNPYVDPMSFTQVELLARWRAGNRENKKLEQALVATVHGIAQGLQNTG